jgi:hypothetical protein
LAATTEKLAAEGLKDMGKGLGFWERTVSRIPGTGRVGLGNAEFREALNANRKLWAINRGTNFAVDAGTAGTVSLGVRGSHEAVNYYEGRKTGGEALKSLAFGVATDSATGGFLGTIGRYGSNQASGLTRMDLSSMRYSPAVGTSFAASAPWMYNAYQAHQAAGSFGEMRDSLNQPVESTAEFKERFEYEPNAITPEQIAEHAGFEITPQMKEDAARREAALKRQEEQRLAQSNE